MGTHRFGAPFGLARQQAPDSDENYVSQLAGSRAGQKTPQRHRGIWSFLVSPFVLASVIAMESVMARAHSIPGDDPADAESGNAKRVNGVIPAPQDQAATLSHAPEESAADQNGSSVFSVATRHSPDIAPEESKKPDLERHATPPSNAAPDGGGGGGGGGGGDDSSNPLDDGNTLDGVQASIGLHDGLLVHLWSGLPDTTIPPIAVDASVGGIHVGAVAGGEPVLPKVPLTVDLGTSLSLKDIVGFDIHLNSDGSFAAGSNDALDQHLPITPPVHATISIADDLPLINHPTLNVLDELFGSAGRLSAAGHAVNLTPIIGTQTTAEELVKSEIKDIATSAKLVGSLVATLPEGGVTINTPTTSGTLDSNVMSGHVHIGLVSEPTIELPAPVPVAGDALFNGHHYTDYHVALQSTGSSPGGSEMPAIYSTVNGVADTVAATPLPEPPTANHGGTPGDAAASTAAPHLDPPITHVGNALDELSIRHLTG